MKMQQVVIDLRELESKRAALSNIPEKIKTLEMQYGAIRSAQTDATPVIGGSGNRREDDLINNMAMRDKLRRDYEICLRDVERLDSALARLPSNERILLERFYISRSKGYVDRLCEELGYERTQIYRLKDTALRNLGMILYGHLEC